MTVKLLGEEELDAVHDDGNSLLTEDGRTMQAIDYPLYERLVAIARWAVKAHAWLVKLYAVEGHCIGCTPCVPDCKGDAPHRRCECGITALLAELTPPTPEERR